MTIFSFYQLARLARSTLTVCLAMPVLMTGSLPVSAQDNAASALPTPEISSRMENPRNPLVAIRTSQGDIHLELFPEAAPQNVERFLDLADARLPVPGSNGGSPAPVHYFDGLTFHRVISNTLIQAGAPERANRQRPAQSVADEINARGLGLEQQRVLDDSGKPHPWLNIGNQRDFKQNVLLPLYRNMNIGSHDELQAQQTTVMQRLQAMNLLQLHELQGYRYDGSLPSRRPGRGSVMLVNRGPGTNDGEFFVTLTNTPWLTGTSTVIGRVAAGLEVVEQISRSPAASTRIFQVRQINSNTTGD